MKKERKTFSIYKLFKTPKAQMSFVNTHRLIRNYDNSNQKKNPIYKSERKR